jgi:hypothetical protein
MPRTPLRPAPPADVAATWAVPRGPRQRLPRTVTPFAFEAATSYTARLAHANHIGVNTLRGCVVVSGTARPQPDWLAVVSGQPVHVLETRLRGLAGDRAALKQHLRRPLCRRCMAGRGIHGPVYCYLPAHLTVCHRHRRWIGPLAHTLDDQVDLWDQPQVLRAARLHRRLANRYAEVDLRAALGDARHMLVYWARAEHREAAAVLQASPHASVSAYPQVIAVAATLLTISAQLKHLGRPTPAGSVALLIDRINERTAAHHVDRTPVEQWVQRPPARR